MTKSYFSTFRDSSSCKRRCNTNEDCNGLEKCYNGKCQEACVKDSDCPQQNLKCLGGRCGYECKCQGCPKKCQPFASNKRWPALYPN